MARGDIEKKEVFAKIKETFDGAFFENDKILRIPINDVEIKVSLTCAKDSIGGNTATIKVSSSDSAFDIPIAAPQSTEITKEEKENVENLMKALGIKYVI